MTDGATPFTCLAIETATARAGVAVGREGRVWQREETGLQAPSRRVYEWLDELLDEARIGLADLDCVAFGAGPGSFTGVRVAAGVAQAIAWARGLPVCRVSSLAALAWDCVRHESVHCVAPCLDARMNQAYLAVYTADPALGVAPVISDRLVTPGETPPFDVPACFAAGPGWAAHPSLVTAIGGVLSGEDHERLPSAAAVLELARRRFAAGLSVSAAEALPNYVRDEVASLPGVARTRTSG